MQGSVEKAKQETWCILDLCLSHKIIHPRSIRSFHNLGNRCVRVSVPESEQVLGLRPRLDSRQDEVKTPSSDCRGLSRNVARTGGQQYPGPDTGTDRAALGRNALAQSSHRHPGAGAKPELGLMVALGLGQLSPETPCPSVTT